jgi:hypothetical protein
LETENNNSLIGEREGIAEKSGTNAGIGTAFPTGEGAFLHPVLLTLLQTSRLLRLLLRHNARHKARQDKAWQDETRQDENKARQGKTNKARQGKARQQKTHRPLKH